MPVCAEEVRGAGEEGTLAIHPAIEALFAAVESVILGFEGGGAGAQVVGKLITSLRRLLLIDHL